MRTVLAALALAGCSPGETASGPPSSAPSPPTPETCLPEVDERFTYHAPRLDMLFLGQTPDDPLLSAVADFVDLLETRGVDYHFGVTDIDYADPDEFGVFRLEDRDGWIRASDPHASVRLLLALQALSHVGISDERGMMAALDALAYSAPGGPNEGFLREGSELCIFIFDFVDDDSVWWGLSQAAFVDRITSIRPEPHLLGFHSYTWYPYDDHPYSIVIEALGGVHWNKLDAAHPPMLTAIAATVEPTNVFRLSKAPDPGTLRIRVVQPDGSVDELAASDVFYLHETLTVDLDGYLPQDGATVEIRYTPAAP